MSNWWNNPNWSAADWGSNARPNSHTWKSQEWKERDWQQSCWPNQSQPRPSFSEPSRPLVPVSPAVKLPSTFVSNDEFLDTTAVGGFQYPRTIQPTEWSRRTGLAGRPIEDVKAYELCHRGAGEFSLRMLANGRFQGLVWTRNLMETVFVTALLRKIREGHVNIDDAARACFGANPPDKHRDSAAFMAPLTEELFQVLKQKAPPVSPEAEDELHRAKAKLAAAGLSLTPTKRQPEGNPDVPSSSARSAKRAKTDVDPTNAVPPAHENPDVAKLLQDPPVRQILTQPKGGGDEDVVAWLDAYKPMFKGNWRQFKKHLQTVQDLLKKHCSRAELVEAAIKFGLDQKMASKLNIRNLSAVIHAAQYVAA